jgi:hypothetical protein
VKSRTDLHATLVRMYELAYEDFGIHGPAALARKLGETTQSVNNWGRKSKTGVSHRGAMNAQRLFGWSAEYIVSGQGPKRLKATLSELIGAPFEIPATMVTYARVAGVLRLHREGDPNSGVKLEAVSEKDERHVLVIYDRNRDQRGEK